jgi:hypothetical protein
MTKKFKAKPFRVWLDDLARNCVKARDGRVCQKSGRLLVDKCNCHWAHIKGRSRNCLRWRLENALTLSGEEHKWGHDNPADFEIWFKSVWPERWTYIEAEWKKPLCTWRESDYREVERYLIEQCKIYNVRPENMGSQTFRSRLSKLMGA